MIDSPVWEEGGWSSLPALEGEIATDVCVIGLGGSGLACILELLMLGRRVAGIDAGMVGGGAAGRNGGFLLAGLPSFYHRAVASFGRERVRDIYLRTMLEMDRMTDETPDAIRRVGSLRIAENPEELEDCKRQIAVMQADGLPAEPYEGPEGKGVLVPTDGAFQPLLRCRTLAADASSFGAELFEQSKAIEITGDCVKTARGRVRCKAVVVAVDGRLERVLPELEGRVRTARLQMLASAPTREVHLPRPVYSRYGYDYWQQLPDGSVAVGGWRDRGGDAEWSDVATPTDHIQAGLEKVLRKRIGVSAAITHRWAGLVGYSTTGMPVVDEVRPAVWALGGYSGTGNVLGAICGRGVAQQLVRGGSDLLSGIRPAS